MLEHSGPAQTTQSDKTMSHSRKKSVSGAAPVGQTKILIAEHPGTTAMLLSDGAQEPMTFPGAIEALHWCEAHRVTFYYIPPAPAAQN
jgi:hypothetical protein